MELRLCKEESHNFESFPTFFACLFDVCKLLSYYQWAKVFLTRILGESCHKSNATSVSFSVKKSLICSRGKGRQIGIVHQNPFILTRLHEKQHNILVRLLNFFLDTARPYQT